MDFKLFNKGKHSECSMDGYEIITKIGKGSCGSVYLVRQITTKRLLALKQIQLDEKKKTRTSEAVLKEARILSKLKHPAIVAYHDSFFDHDNEHLCIVQDYCDGGTLDEVISQTLQKQQHLSEKQILEWFIHIAMAVQYIHSQKVLHRDLKTQNVFLTKSRTCKLGDFGISKSMEQTIDVASTCVGTPCYLSPEICQDLPYSSKADIWALGCLLYELCALRPAFDASNLISLFYKIVKGTYEPIPCHYSENLSKLLSELLIKDSEQRPSARAVLNLPFVKEMLTEFISEKEDLLQTRSLEPSARRNLPTQYKNPLRDQDGKSFTNRSASPQNKSTNLSDTNNVTWKPSVSRSSLSPILAKSDHLNMSVTPQSCSSNMAPDSGVSNDYQEGCVRLSYETSEGDVSFNSHKEINSSSDYVDDFVDSDSADEVSIDNSYKKDIPEELSSVDEDRNELFDESCEYVDDFEEDTSDKEIDGIVNHAKELCSKDGSCYTDYTDELIIDDNFSKLGCKTILQEHCIATLGKSKFEQICREKETQLNFRHSIERSIGDEHLETCYLVSELL